MMNVDHDDDDDDDDGEVGDDDEYDDDDDDDDDDDGYRGRLTHACNDMNRKNSVMSIDLDCDTVLYLV